jgi:hypothetical protein
VSFAWFSQPQSSGHGTTFAEIGNMALEHDLEVCEGAAYDQDHRGAVVASSPDLWASQQW